MNSKTMFLGNYLQNSQQSSWDIKRNVLTLEYYDSRNTLLNYIDHLICLCFLLKYIMMLWMAQFKCKWSILIVEYSLVSKSCSFNHNAMFHFTFTFVLLFLRNIELIKVMLNFSTQYRKIGNRAQLI